jgi:hypothetical protein
MPYFIILPSRLPYYQTNLEIILTFKLHFLPKFLVFFALLFNSIGPVLARENNALEVSSPSSKTVQLHLAVLVALDQIQLL